MSALLLVSAVLAGCGNDGGDSADTEKYLERAESYRHQGQYRAALIEARNAIKQQPNDVDAAVALAQLMNELGQGKQATEALAPYATQNQRELVIAQAKAYLLQRKYQSALDYLAQKTQSAEIGADETIKLLQAEAQISLGQLDAAETALQALENSAAVGPQAQLELAKIQALRGNAAQAEAQLQEILEKRPTDVAVLTLTAELAERSGKLPVAEDLLTRALMGLPETDVLTPQKITVLQRLTLVLTKLGRSSEALVYTKALADSNPQGAQRRDKFKQGMELFQSGKLDEAQALLEEIYQQNPDDLTGTLLGMVKYSKQDFSGAAALLTQHVDPEVATEPVLTALAHTELQMDRPAKLLEMIPPAERERITDPNLKALLGIALLQTGNAVDGEKLAAAALAEQPQHSAIRLVLARHYLQSDQPAKALPLLEQATGDNQDAQGLAQLLVGTYLALGKTDQALQRAQQLVTQYPNAAASYATQGHAALVAKRYDAATTALQRALKLDPKHSAAKLDLAQLALIQKRPGEAQQLYRELATAEPTNAAALKGFITAQEMSVPPPSAAQIEAAVLEFAKTGTARAVLGEYYLRNRQLADAKRVLADARPTGSDGYVHQVKQLYALIVSDQALASKDYAAARTAALDGLREAPNDPRLLSTLARVEIGSGAAKEAEKVIDQLQDSNPNPALILELQGDLAFARKQYDTALDHFRQLWQLSKTDRAANRLYQAKAAKDPASASQFVSEWQRLLPKSPQPHLINAMQRQREGKQSEARQLYEQALALDGNNANALNNLAWLYFEANDKRALATAQKAHDLAPNNPAVLDTMGWILVRTGAVAEGIAKLEKAAELAPQSEEIRQHLQEAKQLL